MSGRGGFIGTNVVPASADVNSAASGLWTLRDQESLKRAGTWPRAFINPTDITGLQLWLDASDASTLFDATTGGSLVAADGGVARWEDKSGNARHMTQGTIANRPLRKTSVQNSRDVLRFDGTNDAMSVPSSTSTFIFLHNLNSTVFLVVKRPSNSVAPLFITYSIGSDRTGYAIYCFDGSSTSDGLGCQVGRGVGGTFVLINASANGFISSSGFNLLTSVTQATNSTAANRSSLRRNGGTATENNTNTGAVNSGASEYDLTLAYNSRYGEITNTDYAEVIVYNSALSDTNRAAVESYLMTKWGIT